MAIYIDAKLAEKNIDNADLSWCTDIDNIIEACIEALQSTPQADVVPVVHAHWIYEIDDLFPADSMMICSNCGEYERLGANDNYCGNCGAKMDEVVG